MKSGGIPSKGYNMKNLILVLGLLVSINAFSTNTRPSVKACFWSRGSNGSKGDMMLITLVEPTIVINDVTHKNWNGTFKNDGKIVKGRDGKTYLSYAGSSVEGYTAILVDETLLAPQTMGWMKIRWRGEAYSEVVYFCRDNR